MSLRPNLLAALKRCIPLEDGDSSNYEEFDYVHLFGHAQQALLLAVIFDPKFIEFEDSVILEQAARDDRALRRFQISRQSSGMSLDALESSFNRIEVPYLFLPSGQDIPEGEWELLAELIARSWRAHLALNFPARRFVVRVEPALGEEEVTVTFHEVRSTV